MTLAAGVDVGGTKIDACIADPLTGDVIARERIRTLPGRPGQGVLDDCVALVVRLAGNRPLSSVGIGVC
jgi:predicted NBD/HSP70 family sugar kinase